MTVISRAGNGGVGPLRSNGYHPSQLQRASSSSSSRFVFGLLCYAGLATLLMLHEKAATMTSSGSSSIDTSGNKANLSSADRQGMANTIRTLRLQVDELSEKVVKAEAEAKSAKAKAAAATSKKLRNDNNAHGANGAAVVTGGGSIEKWKKSEHVSTNRWRKSEYTVESFPVAGVNLAAFGIDGVSSAVDDTSSSSTAATPFQLFDDFDLSDKITGTESWSELLSYRRSQRNLNLAFYVDKVAYKRFLPTIDIPIPVQYHNRYESEMPWNDAFENQGMAGSVIEMIPKERSYVAKASHLRDSDGVLLIRYIPPNPEAGDGDVDAEARTFIGRYDANMKEVDPDDDIEGKTASYLTKHFKERVAGGMDNDSNDNSPWSLAQVAPGLIIEERITLWDSDRRPAMQFQVFVIWGRTFISRWVRGLSPWGLVSREGKVLQWVGMPDNHPEVPDYVDYGKVIEIAEKLGGNKDFLRVDIFVGVSAEENRDVLEEDASEQAKKDAVKIVVSDVELVPTMYELEKEPRIVEEAARLWIAGYQAGKYETVPNTEIPEEFRKNGKLSQENWTKNWIKTKYTLSKFESMGVNLASYHMPPSELDDIGENEEPFELYDNFNIAHMITGNENWWDLVAYRRELASPGLNFYVDKVAQKRWLPTIDMPIPRPFLCRYLSEIPTPDKNAGIPAEYTTIKTMLPQESNYAAKPSHTSCSDGVWLVKYENGVTKIAAGGRVMKEATDEKLNNIAVSLAKNLHENPRDLESIALKTVSHGFVVEERFTGLEADDRPAMEFKIFCFWGRVWVANWRRGSSRWGLLNRDGTVINWAGKKGGHDTLPEWVDWDRVIEIAEKMARHKDMFRVDLFVGLPASSPALREGATDKEKKAAVEIVISEFEVHPTTKFKDPRLFEEAARLWIAGYKKLNWKEISNDEVPKDFIKSAEFPAPPESREWVETKHTTKSFKVAGVDLGPYRMPGVEKKQSEELSEEPFELFEEFDISDKISGNEAWWDLVTIRIGLKDKPALPFYNDKVALRRYLPAVGVPMPKSFVLKYKGELTTSGEEADETEKITHMLPKEDDFVAKPSHSCFGDDVWLVKHHMENGKNVVSVNGGVGRQRMRPKDDFDREEIGKALTKTLHLEPHTYGSWVYDNIKPGIVVEERFAAIDDDNKPAVEFKVFTIWGKCYIAQWRRGTYSGIVYPDGSVVEWGNMKKSSTELPDWVDWSKIKELAEKMGKNKDMFRTDIFVGVSSSDPALKEGASDKEKRKAVKVVVSEFEMQPGTLQMDPGIFDDAARLWIAGYKNGNYKAVPNTQVPKAYVEKGLLSEEDIPDKSR